MPATLLRNTSKSSKIGSGSTPASATKPPPRPHTVTDKNQPKQRKTQNVTVRNLRNRPLRAAATMAGPSEAVARGATLRRTLINIPARIARPQRRPMLHLPAHWPWANAWLTLWGRILGDDLPPPIPA